MTQILQQKCKIKGGTREWRLRNMCLAWHSYKFGTLFISLLWVICAKKNCLAKMWGEAIAPSDPRCRRAWYLIFKILVFSNVIFKTYVKTLTVGLTFFFLLLFLSLFLDYFSKYWCCFLFSRTSMDFVAKCLNFKSLFISPLLIKL